MDFFGPTFPPIPKCQDIEFCIQIPKFCVPFTVCLTQELCQEICQDLALEKQCYANLSNLFQIFLLQLGVGCY